MASPDRPLTLVSRNVPPGTTIEFRPSSGEIVHIAAPVDTKGLVITERIQYEDETGLHVKYETVVIPQGAFGTNIRGDNATIYSYTRSE